MRLGFDLGGTNLAYGLVDQGTILEKGSIKLDDLEPEAIAAHMKVVYKQLSSQHEITAVGIGVPGLVSQKEGLVITCVNLKWKNVPLVDLLSDAISVPVVVGNDANAAAIAEIAYGSMQGVDDGILLTLGTGLGGGVVTGGKLLIGHHGAGAELGHILLKDHGDQCNCGNVGCFETEVSATALIRKYNQAAPTPVHDAKSVFDRMSNGDDVAIAVVNEFCKQFARGIVSLYNIFSPQVVALGGGVAKAYPHFIHQLEHEVNQRIFTKDLSYGKIVEASLGNDAGIIGAAYLGDYE